MTSNLVTEPIHTLIQISDPHVKPDGLLHDSVDTIARLNRCLEMIERSPCRPEALVFSGDLVNWGEREAYQTLRKMVEPVAAAWGSEVIYVPGNHDVDPLAFREEIFGLGVGPDEVDRVYWLGGLRVIGMDSTAGIPQHHGVLSTEQLRWLAAELERPAPDGSILVMHHSPLPSPIPLIDVIVLQDREALSRVVAGTDVRMILCGHGHYTGAGGFAGIPVWIAPATVYQTEVLSGEQHRAVVGGGFTRIDIYADSVLATEIPLLDNPATVYEGSVAELLEHMRLGTGH